jgi:hypothetical protein
MLAGMLSRQKNSTGKILKIVKDDVASKYENIHTTYEFHKGP